MKVPIEILSSSAVVYDCSQLLNTVAHNKSMIGI